VAAGKISGPGGAPPSDVPPAPAKKAEIAGADAKAEGAFADKLREAAAPRGAAGASAAEQARGITAELAADLGAGKITPQAAIDRVIDRIVDKQVGADAPAAVRDRVRAALESAVADDPVLSEKIKALGSI
jgi:hypothetical protein